MNDLNGRIVPETSTALPTAVIGVDVNEYNSLRATVAALEAENAELRKKCMTNMERIQTADIDALAAYLREISFAAWDSYRGFVYGALDAAFDFARDSDSLDPIKEWLQKTEWD